MNTLKNKLTEVMEDVFKYLTGKLSTLDKSESDIVKRYLFRFGSRNQIDFGIFPSLKKTIVQAIDEIVIMFESNVFYIRGKENVIDRIILLESLRDVSARDYLVGITNNNYLKKVLQGKMSRVVLDNEEIDNWSVKNDLEGY